MNIFGYMNWVLSLNWNVQLVPSIRHLSIHIPKVRLSINMNYFVCMPMIFKWKICKHSKPYPSIKSRINFHIMMDWKIYSNVIIMGRFFWLNSGPMWSFLHRFSMPVSIEKNPSIRPMLSQVRPIGQSIFPLGCVHSANKFSKKLILVNILNVINLINLFIDLIDQVFVIIWYNSYKNFDHYRIHTWWIVC